MGGSGAVSFAVRHQSLLDYYSRLLACPDKVIHNLAFVRQVVLVLSATVLVLVLERIAMTRPTFDHERLDVYRLSIQYVAFSFAFSYGIAKTLARLNRPARDQWLRAAQSIPLNMAEGNGEQSLKDQNRFFENRARIGFGMCCDSRRPAGMQRNGR